MALAEVRLGHQTRTDRKRNGATYTPGPLAQVVAKHLLTSPLTHGNTLHILDPGTGDGALSKALLAELPPGLLAQVHLYCVDLDEDALCSAERDIRTSFPEITLTRHCGDFLAYAERLVSTGHAFDLVISNPPYVRTQALPEALRSYIRDELGLPGRADLSFAFIAAILKLLKPAGQAAIITSNKILTTAAGSAIRGRIEAHSSVRIIWDLGDTRLFDAAVLPCVLFLGGKDLEVSETAFIDLYEASSSNLPDDSALPVTSVLAGLAQPGRLRLPNGQEILSRHGTCRLGDRWRIDITADADWERQIGRNTWARFEDVCRIRVGIKTTADKIFISDHWTDPRPELLRPLITHHDAGRFKASNDATREVLYPYEEGAGARSVVNLDRYPRSQAWLERHRTTLEDRSYLKEANRDWFEIWVPHHPSDWKAPKIVFRDIAERPTFWLDTSGAVVNGDCYWIRMNPEQDPTLLWLLLAVANSRLIERFYDTAFNERLYAGRRRFMTRHVRQFPVPDPGLPASIEAAALAKRLAEDKDLAEDQRQAMENQISDLVETAFGLPRPGRP